MEEELLPPKNRTGQFSRKTNFNTMNQRSQEREPEFESDFEEDMVKMEKPKLSGTKLKVSRTRTPDMSVARRQPKTEVDSSSESELEVIVKKASPVKTDHSGGRFADEKKTTSKSVHSGSKNKAVEKYGHAKSSAEFNKKEDEDEEEEKGVDLSALAGEYSYVEF